MRTNRQKSNDCRLAAGREISRRTALGSSALTILGVLSGSASGRENAGEAGRSGPPKEFLERMEQSRAFSERMRNAASMEERAKIMEERGAWERKRAIGDLKEQLGIPDQEWTVVRARVEAVYSLVHPQNQFGQGNAQPTSPLEQKKSELRELLRNKDAKPEQIKGRLSALRTAREKAKQDLRQIMSLCQEAVLVLNGLLD